MNILTIGGSGLVGSRIKKVLSKKNKVSDLSLEDGINITQVETLRIINKKKYDVIILYAAKADVDGCEKDKDAGTEGAAYRINVDGIQNIISIVKETGKKIIYISTDFVFNGVDTPNAGYTEKDTPDPVNWYARTKYLGEKTVKKSGLPYLITRIAYPYSPSLKQKVNPKGITPKKNFVDAILTRLQNKLPVLAITDHIMTPTYLDDIAIAFNALITENKEGIYHVTGSQHVTPYEAAMLIAGKFNLDKSLISKTTRAEFFKNRAPRPFNLTMNNDKIQQLGIKMRGFEEGLKLIK